MNNCGDRMELELDFEYWTNKYGYTYPFYLCLTNKTDLLQNFLTVDVLREKEKLFGCTLLHISCENNNFEMCQMLLDFLHTNGILEEIINEQDHHLDTALHTAAYQENKEICKLFLKYNARTDIKNIDNESVSDILVLEGMPRA